MQTQAEDLESIRDLLRWQWAGPWFQTYTFEEPEIHERFLRLEKLGVVYPIEVRRDGIAWLIDYPKAKEIALNHFSEQAKNANTN